VRGNAKHAQKSMEDSMFGFCEAISHCLNIVKQSRLALFAMKTQLAASDAEERTTAKIANVREYMLSNILSIWRKATESLARNISANCV